MWTHLVGEVLQGSAAGVGAQDGVHMPRRRRHSLPLQVQRQGKLKLKGACCSFCRVEAKNGAPRVCLGPK